jgi:hypothetical protein
VGTKLRVFNRLYGGCMVVLKMSSSHISHFVGRGHVSLSTDLDQWHNKPF